MSAPMSPSGRTPSTGTASGQAGSSPAGVAQFALSRLSVRPSEIEKGLERLRLSAPSAQGSAPLSGAGPETGSGHGETANTIPQPRMRAVLANIVVLVRSDGQFGNESNLDRFISHLAAAHPSRFFIIRLNDDHATPVEAQVTSRQVTPDSGAHLFSEEIYLDVSPNSTDIVPNLLLSLFVADVDVVLVIPEPIGRRAHEEKLLRGLRKFARLVLFDSASCSNYGHDVRLLLDQCGGLDEQPRQGYFPQMRRFSDVSWRRTKRWRSLLSECFDTERLIGAQNGVSRIKFFVCREVNELSSGLLSSDSFLVAGWCAACLSWDLRKSSTKKTPKGVIIDARQSDGKTLAQLEFVSWRHSTLPEQSIAAPRDPAFGLAGIEIVIHPAADAVRLKITRLFDRNAAEILLGATSTQLTSGSCEFAVRYAPFRSQTMDELVFRDILSNRGEDVYRKALENSLLIADAL